MTCECTHDYLNDLKLVIRKTICPYHAERRIPPEDVDETYYRKFGVISESGHEIAPSNHVREILEQIVTFDGKPGKTVLEIGCGISPYLRHLVREGFTYTGLDASHFACEWLSRHYDVRTVQGRLETTMPGQAPYDLVLAAHVLEHIPDPVAALAKMRDLIYHDGRVVIVVPEGTDLYNPDHDCFFNNESLVTCAHLAGLCVQRISVARYTEHERFIYAVLAKREFPRFAPGVDGEILTTLSEEAAIIDLVPATGTMIEIGSANGGTAHQVASARPGATITCVDEFSMDATMYNRWMTNQLGNMHLHRMSIEEFVRQNPDRQFDLAFVDADHSYQSCLRDLLCSSLLVRRGGVIIAHDYTDPNHRDVTQAVHSFCAMSGWQFCDIRGSMAMLRSRL